LPDEAARISARSTDKVIRGPIPANVPLVTLNHSDIAGKLAAPGRRLPHQRPAHLAIPKQLA
jgi:hypothetical protein